MKIRIATEADLKSMVAIYNQSIRAGRITAHTKEFSPEERRPWFESHPPNQYPIFVAEVEGEVLAYASLSPYRSGRLALSLTAEISYYVHFDHHRKGIGDALVKSTIAFARENDFEVLLAILMDANEGSVGLLKKNGFTEWGRMPKVLSIGNDRLDHLYYGLHLK